MEPKHASTPLLVHIADAFKLYQCEACLWTFVENELKIQCKTRLQDCRNYLCKLYNLEIFQNYYSKMYHLENLADQMKIITSVVDGWTRWSWELALKRKCRPTFENTCITHFRAVNQNFSSSPDVCLVSKDGHSLYTQRLIIFHYVLFFFFEMPFNQRLKLFPSAILILHSPLVSSLLSTSTSTSLSTLSTMYLPFSSSGGCLDWSKYTLLSEYSSDQATFLNAPQPSYLFFVSCQTGWHHHLKGDYYWEKKWI